MIDVMICVGHSRIGDKCGALSVHGEDEYSYNRQVAARLRDKCEAMGLKAEVLSDYPRKGYTSSMKWVGDRCFAHAAKIAIELHFNSSDKASSAGHEWLIYHRSAAGRKLARCFESAMITARPNAKQRGIKELSSTIDRGFGFVHFTPCPAVVQEPFFGSNAEEAAEFIPHPETLASIYAEALDTYFNETASA